MAENKREETDATTKESKFNKVIKISELLIKLISVFVGASMLIAFFGNVQFGFITNNYQEKLSLEKKLLLAQNYYLDGYYIKAYELYEECYDHSPIASLNLGYLYSTGLGCTQDFSLACRYYIKAYEKGLQEGLTNYLAINLITPSSFEETIAALTYGYDQKSEVAIHYLAYFETGTMHAELYDCCWENAKVFLGRSIYEQTEKMKDKLTLNNAEMIRIEGEETPQDSDFITFAKYDDFLECVGNKSVRVPVDQNGTRFWEIKNVNAYGISTYYLVSHFRFEFTDHFISENFYKV